jgi:hypothetical protein
LRFLHFLRLVWKKGFTMSAQNSRNCIYKKNICRLLYYPLQNDENYQQIKYNHFIFAISRCILWSHPVYLRTS